MKAQPKGFEGYTVTDFGVILRDKAYIGGQWVFADSGRTFPVSDPATGSQVAAVPDMGAKEAGRAVAAARQAFPAWRALTAKERSRIIRRWHDLIIENLEPMAKLQSAEQGRPLDDARGEVLYGASYVEWFAEEAKRIYGDTMPSHKSDARVIVTKEPVGVVAAITPWNFPTSMITRKTAPALAAGCTVVLKPAEDTPLSALALAALAEQAGFPPGVFNVVTGSRESAAVIGEALCTHPDVRKISFTGSTRVGKILYGYGAGTVKKLSLELGGNAPFIVFESADLEKAADGLIARKFRNAGQTCITANRVYVQDSVYDAFAALLAAKVKDIKTGPGYLPDSDMGPLINEKAVEKVRQHVEDALVKGAELLCGGRPHSAGPLFYQPTVLKNMTASMRLKDEETFGPVAALFRFSGEADVIATANDTPYGLASYLYTGDLGQAFRVADALEYGMVGVNEPNLSSESIPFGGIKESGIGREGSKYGIEEFVEIKYILVGGLQQR